MANQKAYKKLEQALSKLNETSKKLISTRGYTSEVENLKILEELLKEQLQNENTRLAARQAR